MGQHAEGPDVGRRADLHAAFADLRPEQVGRGVVGRREGRRVGVGALQFRRHVEVAEPRRAVGHQQDVPGLEVAVHPARPVQLVESLADLGEEGGARLRHPAGQQGVQGPLGLLQDEHGRAVEFGAAWVVDGEHLVHPDQPGCAHAAQHLGLTGGELAQVAQLARGAGAGREDLERGPSGQTRLGGGAQGRVHAAEGAGPQQVADDPGADPVARRNGEGT